MRIAVLVKQVPEFEAMRLGPDGRLEREGLTLEMNPYCRRAVSKGVELARETGGSCTVVTLGPPSAEDSLREAIAWGVDDGILITDPAFAGSDTLATARALAPVLADFDLILCGRNSVDADTGQVPPEIAELLDRPFVGGARTLAVDGRELRARCEHDDGWADVATTLPAVVSCAERLCDPAKVDPEGRAAVDGARITTRSAAEVGPGPWGQAASPTAVGQVRRLEAARAGTVLDGSIDEQVAQAVAFLRDRGALEAEVEAAEPVPEPASDRLIVVLLEPDRPAVARELLGAAAVLGGRVVAVGRVPDGADTWGADAAIELDGSMIADDVAGAMAEWCDERRPWAVLAAGTMWGREVMGRVAARLGAGLTGDAVDLGVRDGRLVGWKPAFGGSLVAAITATSPVQMATVRPGVLPVRSVRPSRSIERQRLHVPARGRVQETASGRDDAVDVLARAEIVVGVGAGVAPGDYRSIEALCRCLGAEMAASRKATDKGWMPRARQVGLTGRSIGPRLYVAIGLSGKFNHMVGVRGAGAVLAINPDPEAPIWDNADIGIVARWEEVVPRLIAALTEGQAETGPDRLTAASSVPR